MQNQYLYLHLLLVLYYSCDINQCISVSQPQFHPKIIGGHWDDQPIRTLAQNCPLLFADHEWSEPLSKCIVMSPPAI